MPADSGHSVLRPTPDLDRLRPAPAFDRLARLAARLLHAPIALVILTDARGGGETVAGTFGVPHASGGVSGVSPACRAIVETGASIVVRDARSEPLPCELPALATLGAVACLGVPIDGDTGLRFGALCVMDTVPRAWSEQDLATLVDLGAEIACEVDLRRLMAERERLLGVLRESEERFRLAQRATNDVLWDWDVTTGRLSWGEHHLGQLRHPPSEEQRSIEWWTDHIHSEERARVMDGLNAVLAGRTENWAAEYRFRRGDGTYAHVVDRAFVLRDERGRAVRMIGAMQDVTERAALQAQLLQAQRMEAIGRLAGGVAHDFNNLLTVIAGGVAFAHAELHPRSPAARDLDEVAHASRRAAELTRQLLAFGRRQLLQPRRVDVNLKVANVAGMLRRVIGEDVQIETELVGAPWPVYADPGQLEQVLLNLAVNARDAMPGGGTLRIRTANVQVDDAMAHARPGLAPGPYVSITVQDSGVGIAPELVPHIFEPFVTTKDSSKGTGLGLATVYGIVKQSGGHVSVESAPGQGATFTVLLPRDMDAGAAGAPSADASPRGGNETVLLVEDEAAVRLVVRRMLTRSGYRVLEAAAGDEALRIWRGLQAGGPDAPPERIDLVLTDLVMPAFGGRLLVEKLRAEGCDAPIIVMTGYTADTAGAQAALERGDVSALLQKPIPPEQLLRTVRDVLDGAVPERGGRG